MEELAVEPAPAAARHRRSSALPFMISALLIVGVGGAIITLIQASSKIGDGRESAFVASRPNFQNSMPAQSSSRPTFAPQSADDGSNMVGDAKQAVNTLLVDAPASLQAPAAQVTRPAQGETGPGLAPPILSVADQRLLDAVTGGWNSANAAKIGAERGLIFKLGEQLFRYPRVLSFVLNSPIIVGGIMRQDRVRQNCSDPAALRSYLKNGRSLDGVSRGLQFFQASTRYPGATQALLESQLMKTVLSKQCPAVDSLKYDQNALADVMIGNPQIATALGNPALLSAVNANPSTRRLYSDVLKMQDSFASAGH